MKTHNLLCKEKCEVCGRKRCYAHPDMIEHKCADCLVENGELIEEEIGFIDGIKQLAKDWISTIKYFIMRMR